MFKKINNFFHFKEYTNSHEKIAASIAYSFKVSILFFLLFPLPRFGFFFDAASTATSSLLIPTNLAGFAEAWMNTTFGSMFIFGLIDDVIYFLIYFVLIALFNYIVTFFSPKKRFIMSFVLGVLITIPLFTYGTRMLTDEHHPSTPLFAIPSVALNPYDRIASKIKDDTVSEEKVRKWYKGKYIEIPNSFLFPAIDGYTYDPFIFAAHGGPNCILIKSKTGVCFGGKQVIVVFTKDNYQIQKSEGYYYFLETTDYTLENACESGWPAFYTPWASAFDYDKCLETKRGVLNGIIDQTPNKKPIF